MSEHMESGDGCAFPCGEWSVIPNTNRLRSEQDKERLSDWDKLIIRFCQEASLLLT